MKSFKFFSLLLFVGLVFVSCEDDDPEPVFIADSYYVTRNPSLDVTVKPDFYIAHSIVSTNSMDSVTVVESLTSSEVSLQEVDDSKLYFYSEESSFEPSFDESFSYNIKSSNGSNYYEYDDVISSALAYPAIIDRDLVDANTNQISLAWDTATVNNGDYYTIAIQNDEEDYVFNMTNYVLVKDSLSLDIDTSNPFWTVQNDTIESGDYLVTLYTYKTSSLGSQINCLGVDTLTIAVEYEADEEMN